MAVHKLKPSRFGQPGLAGEPQTQELGPPLSLPPLSPARRQSLLAEQAAFDQQFPPLSRRDDDILIVGWAEIERQFLDLCAPWDRTEQALLIQAAQQSSLYESPEKTLRTLFVLNHMRSSIDSRRGARGRP